MELSVIVTLKNEEDNIVPLMAAIHNALKGNIAYEVILVDDGSTDATVARIKQLADPLIKLIILYKNYGQTSAMKAGIDAAEGRLLVTLDGDLQNDPSDILPMIKILEEGEWDVVAGRRFKRQDGFLVRKIPSKIANYIIRRSTGVYLHDYGCTLRVFRREMAQSLGLYGELHRFIPVLISLQGGRTTEVDVKHHARQFGSSKYGLNRTFKVISDLLLMVFFQKYMQKPMHLFAPTGLGAFGIGSLILTYLFVLKLLGEDIWGRPLMIVGTILLLGGLQLLVLGVLAEIIMRTYYESQGKTIYRIRKIWQAGIN